MLKNFKKKKNNKGFTLVELLVVIAIIGVLAVVAVPSLFKQVNKAKASDAVAYISAARTAAISEYVSTSTVPTATAVEALVEDKPDSISGSIDIPEPAAGATKITMKVTLTKADIASQVKAQLGTIAEIDDTNSKIVVVDVYTIDTTS